jgi:hypothetical protein
VIAAIWEALAGVATIVAIAWLVWTIASVLEVRRVRKHLRLVHPKRRGVLIRFRRSA